IHADPEKDVKKWKVILTVRGTMNHDAQKERTLAPMSWDDSWSSGGEAPVSQSSPMSIPALGIAYWVNSQVVRVEPGSPADRAGIQANDLIVQARFGEASRTVDKVSWGPWMKLHSQRGKDTEVYDQWAHIFWALQRNDFPMVEFRIKRDDELLPD